MGEVALGHRGSGYLHYKDITSEGLAQLCIHDYGSKAPENRHSTDYGS